MNYCVYKHTTPDGKCYIGISSNPNDRWAYGKSYKHNKHFQEAIQIFGWENIKHEILFDNLTKEEAEQKEIEMIELYKSNILRYGYNIRSGGKGQGYSVKQYSLHGKLLNIFPSAKAAAQSVGISTSIICDVCNRKKSRKTAGGYVWRYINDDFFDKDTIKNFNLEV